MEASDRERERWCCFFFFLWYKHMDFCQSFEWNTSVSKLTPHWRWGPACITSPLGKTAFSAPVPSCGLFWSCYLCLARVPKAGTAAPCHARGQVDKMVWLLYALCFLPSGKQEDLDHFLLSGTFPVHQPSPWGIFQGYFLCNLLAQQCHTEGRRNWPKLAGSQHWMVEVRPFLWVHFQLLLYHCSPALLELLHQASSLRAELREVRDEWHCPTHSLPNPFLKPFLACCWLRLFGSQADRVVMGPNNSPKPYCTLSRSLGDVPPERLEGTLSCSLNVEHHSFVSQVVCRPPALLTYAAPWWDVVVPGAARAGWRTLLTGERDISCQIQLEASNWALPSASAEAQGQYVQVATISEHRLESTTAGGCPWVSHLISGCSALQSVLSQPSHIRLQLDSVQKQGAVPLKEKAKEKSNHEHWSAINLWPMDLPVLSDEWRECAIIPWACASRDVQHITTEFTASQAALPPLSTLQSNRLESTLETFPFHSAMS